ncbi:SDR family NAD(P)-dependent oxidoreductase [Marinivivus vitaminiproducens]|uniref:SDR family NAD(P)-dependent oxidoreductase n=1 Tax=Marinivivus vitaminiproducens TaxID=3035935 RepID=UPI0027988D21|nr:SDR family NAD(P)-dependent oxidoreductase [Geminicoccaceae bacterium SCSIO 64248]
MERSERAGIAVVTGASTGIGFELACQAAEHGFDLVVVSNDGQIEEAAGQLERTGARVWASDVDLATKVGVDALHATIKTVGRPIDLLMANAGVGLGGGFLDQEPDAWRRVVDTNVTGTLDVIHRIGREMRSRDAGRILITGSIAGFLPGSFQAVYNGTKAFLDSFAFALRNELRDTKVTVTCLMPGATETAFFERAGMEDTGVGQAAKDDPTMVARVGFAAMMRGEGDIVSGWKNKLASAVANVIPSGALAEVHRKGSAPGSGR